MTRALLLAAIILFACGGAAHAQEVIEYYGTDHLGSVRVVFDAAGNVIARADYLPFGEEIFAPTGPMPAEQFTGQARDGEAGQDYFHARMYQPQTGRFNAVDPVYAGLLNPQRWNRYAYAGNDALNMLDPSGMHFIPNNGVCSAEYQYCDGHDPDGGMAWFVPIGWPPAGGGWQPPASSPPPGQPPDRGVPAPPEGGPPHDGAAPAPPGTPPRPQPPRLPGPGGVDWPENECGPSVQMAMPPGERRWRGNINDNGDEVAVEAKRRGGQAGKRYIEDWLKQNPDAAPARKQFLRGYAKVLGRAAGGAAGIVLLLLWPDPLYAPTLDRSVAGCP